MDAIINPNSGPGEGINEDYRKLCVRLRRAGVGILGYVSTRYGERPMDEVRDEIGKYDDWCGVRDIFLDEAASDTINLRYYSELYEISLGKTVLNHGTIPDEAYLYRGDILVIFESTYAKHTLEKFPGWIKRWPKNRFATLAHSCPDARKMKRAVAKASETSGYVYVTSDVEPNPWDQLPSYWQAELKACK